MDGSYCVESGKFFEGGNTMRNMRAVPIIVALMVLAIALVGCGPSKADLEKSNAKFAALKSAAAVYQEFLIAQNGDSAVMTLDKMRATLQAQGLSFNDLSVSETEMHDRVVLLYLRNAAEVYKRLQNTRGNMKQAQTLATQYGELVGKAGQTVSPKMERSLALQVARNFKEEGVAMERAHGVLPPAKKALVAKRPVAKKAATLR